MVVVNELGHEEGHDRKQGRTAIVAQPRPSLCENDPGPIQNPASLSTFRPYLISLVNIGANTELSLPFDISSLVDLPLEYWGQYRTQPPFQHFVPS